jgi:PPM family protein phosphatase
MFGSYHYRGLSTGAGTAAAGRPSLVQHSMLDVEFAQLSDRGRVREQNEDYLGCVLPATPADARNQGWLFVLADGVGGHGQGEVASRAAVESLLAGFRAARGEPNFTLVKRLVQAANSEVYETGFKAGPGGSFMATTLVTCALRHDHAFVAHVGDSRCYLIRQGQVALLTRDHTIAGEQVRLGVLSAQEAAEAPTRHLLSRSLGTSPFVNVETSDQRVVAGDLLLLCSDGLHGVVTAPEMASLAGSGRDLTAAAQELVALANERDGSDNVSVQLIRIRGVERMGMYRGRPYKLR